MQGSNSSRTPHRILTAYFKRKQSKNKAYSLRALARDLGKSPSFVSQILNGKRKASPELLTSLADLLDLDPMAKQQLGLALVLHSALPEEIKETYKNSQTEGREEYAAYQESSFVDFDVLQHWYYVAILDLCSLVGFQPEARWIGKTLGISEDQAEAAIADLFAKGLLQKNPEGWKKAAFKLRFSTTASRHLVRSYHRQMIEKSLVELNEKTDADSFKNRLITGLCLAVNPHNLERAKVRLEEALFEVSKILTEGECTQLYHVNLQLFPLTKPELKK